jgi:hypothetical protein
MGDPPKRSMITVAPCWWPGSWAAELQRRMRLICRCWSIATESPNQAMLLTLTKIVGAVAGSAKRAPSSSPNRSS